MIRKTFLVCLAVLMITGTAGAGEILLAPTPASMAGLGQFSTAARDFSPIAKPAGYACRRDCTRCRNHCYAAYRINCYGPGCRQNFVLCMRSC